MNKKALVLLGALCLGATVGCDKDNSSSVNNNSSSNTPVEQKVNYSIGLGYTTSFKATQAEVNVAVAAFDNAGKILNARLDVVQIPLTVLEDGKAGIDTSKNPNQLSKLELGLDYNMLNSSAIKKEVYLQIEAFADWTVGKTVEEVVAGTPGAGHGEAVNDELKNSVTITVDAFETALADAYANKVAATEGTVANAGVGIYVGMYGENELTTYIAGAITDANDKVEAMLIDNVVFPLAVTEGAVSLAAGKYVGENNTIISKKKLGEDYKMDDYMTPETCTGGDWYKQAAAYEKGVVGKTATEIKDLAKNSIAGCTIIIEDINKSAAEAAEYASKDVITAKPQA